MIAIQRHGTYKKFQYYACGCPACGCEFTCEEEDLITVEEGENDENGNPSFVVQECHCPDCKDVIPFTPDYIQEVYHIYSYDNNEFIREEVEDV